jgi:UDP-N-acetylmuramate--alanine ligase
VIEADEYDRAFLGLQPDVAIVTNVEHDHPDCYPTPESFQEAFQHFVSQVREHLIVCLDNPGAASLEHAGVDRTTYGWNPDADWRPEKLGPNEVGGVDFFAQRTGRSVGRIRTRIPGEHNALNVLAAIAAASYLEVPFEVTQAAVEGFRGTGRRFETMGVAQGVAVIDDYAHHPTEVRATLAAARQRFPRGKIWAVFQPHTYSRTRTLLATLALSFKDADHVLVTEVFAAREHLDLSISGKILSEVIEHEDVEFVADFAEAADRLAEGVHPGDAVIIMSAGDANQIGRLLLDRLASKAGGRR